MSLPLLGGVHHHDFSAMHWHTEDEVLIPPPTLTLSSHLKDQSLLELCFAVESPLGCSQSI